MISHLHKACKFYEVLLGLRAVLPEMPGNPLSCFLKSTSGKYM